MSTMSTNATNNAKQGGESPLLKNEAGLQTNFSVMQALRSFCKIKSLSPLNEIRAAIKSRASDRMIQYWLSNKYSISVDDLAALIRSDAGFAILENIIGDAKPVWWLDFKRSVKRAEVRRQQASLKKQIEELDQGEFEV